MPKVLLTADIGIDKRSRPGTLLEPEIDRGIGEGVPEIGRSAL